MFYYVEVQVDGVPSDVRIAAEQGLDFAIQHLNLPDIAIRWFEPVPREAKSAWFRSEHWIVGTVNLKELDHIRINARLVPFKAAETAAHEGYHIWSALDHQAKGQPMPEDDDPDEHAAAVEFAKRYLDGAQPP